MAFSWLDDFQKGTEKREDYAAKTLAAYRLGMKAGGSIVGVAVQTGKDPCSPATVLDLQAIHHPDDAPKLPLPGCGRGRRCSCVYRPVMVYQVPPDEAERLRELDRQKREAEQAARRRKKE